VARLAGGPEKLKHASKTLTKINFNLTSPDGNPIRIFRRGTRLAASFFCQESAGHLITLKPVIMASQGNERTASRGTGLF
jgi:hypothetical protein